MKENYTVCHCKQVTYAQIADVLESHTKFDSVLEAFEDVQHVTHCSTGCGGCHQKIMDILSDLMMGY